MALLESELSQKFSSLEQLDLEYSQNAQSLAAAGASLALARVSYQATRDVLDAAILQYEKDKAAYEISKSSLDKANLELSASNLGSALDKTKEDSIGINDILKFASGLLAALVAGLKAFLSLLGIFPRDGSTRPSLPNQPYQPQPTVPSPGLYSPTRPDQFAIPATSSILPLLLLGLFGLWGLNENLKKK